MKKKLVLLFYLSFTLMGYAQDIVYNDDGSVTFNNKDLKSIEYDNIDFNYFNLLSLNNNSTQMNGIIGDIYQGGGIVFEVLGGLKKDKVIFKKILVTTSTQFGGELDSIPWHGIKLASNQTKLLASDLKFTTASPDKCTAIADPTLFRASMVSGYGNYSFKNPYFDCLKDNNFNQIQKVKVKITAKKAKVKRVRFPGQVQEVVLASANPAKQFSVTIFINGANKGTVTPSSIPTFNAKVGDDIKFVFNNSFSSFKRKPVFEGIPATWIAQFGGESKYYCTPSIQPNERKPWIGFDSQVHGSLLRRYPAGYKERFPDFEKDKNGNIVSWTFTLQREMDAGKTTYVPTYKWAKEKTSPVKQRNNQKEGLNVELLQAFDDPTFQSYKGQDYILGSDPDEIFYLAGQDYDTFENPPLQGLLRKTDEVWKKVPYGESEDPINDIVSAYMKNRDALDGNINYSSQKYNSYEIQDNGTSPSNPDGTGTGNNKAPGLCKISLGNVTVQFKLNVTNSLSNQNGFYANIKGTRWPGWDETETYKFSGFKNMSNEELSKYFIVCTSENSIANVRKQIVYFKDLDNSKLTKITKDGYIEHAFEMGGNGYNNLTLYKYNSNKTDSTIIGGKELLTIVLRFVTVPNGNAGMQLGEIADGSHIYLEEYRNDRSGDPMYIQRYGRYMKKFTREYVIPRDSTLTFYTLDSDPFTFFNTSTEWYLSSRYQARRLPLTGEESQESNVEYYLDPLNPDGSVKELTSVPVGRGSKFTHSYRNVGDYQLRVTYRNSKLDLYHKIKVVNYNPPVKGSIVIRELTDRERKLLNFNDKNYKMAEVKDILCSYTFVDGYRTQNPINRFGRYNDYFNSYVWNNRSGGIIYNPDAIVNKISNYSEHSWVPFNWVRHFSDKPYPGTIDPSLFRNKEDLTDYLYGLYEGVPEPWQVRLPWAPYTVVEGQRFRTNIKVIYDMYKFFNNQTGAFSGNPRAISTEEVFNKFITDDEEDLKELINDLKYGRKIVITKSLDYLKVSNLSNQKGKPAKFIADLMSRSTKAVEDISTGVEDNNIEIFKVYPIPCDKAVNICLPNLDSPLVKGSLYNNSGQLIFSDYFLMDSSNRISIITDKYPSGIYIIHLASVDNEWSRSEKIIVKH